MATPPWLDDARDLQPLHPRKLKDAPTDLTLQKEKVLKGKNVLMASFNGPNGHHPFASDEKDFKPPEAEAVMAEVSAQETKDSKKFIYVPPWQQDLLVPKGFKAAAFIRATGGTKGSDRGALEAATKEEDGAPAVFNAPIKYVPPWQQDQLVPKNFKPEKFVRAQGGNKGGDRGALVLGDNGEAAYNAPMSPDRPFGTHDELDAVQDTKRKEKDARGKAKAASWTGEAIKPPWVSDYDKAASEVGEARVAPLEATLAAAAARAQLLDEQLSAAEELMRSMRQTTADLHAQMVNSHQRIGTRIIFRGARRGSQGTAQSSADFFLSLHDALAPPLLGPAARKSADAHRRAPSTYAHMQGA
jgi:hypothetical protein